MISDNMDEPWEHYAKWDKSDKKKKKTYTVWYHFFLEFETAELSEKENRMVVTRG